jgi:hypothetical protein
MTRIFNEAERQMIILALAHLSVERPGWDAALSQIAQRCGRDGHGDGVETFTDYKILRTNAVALANQAAWLKPQKKKRARKKRTPNYAKN